MTAIALKHIERTESHSRAKRHPDLRTGESAQAGQSARFTETRVHPRPKRNTVNQSIRREIITC
jgi:hypothetical protein